MLRMDLLLIHNGIEIQFNRKKMFSKGCINGQNSIIFNWKSGRLSLIQVRKMDKYPNFTTSIHLKNKYF